MKTLVTTTLVLSLTATAIAMDSSFIRSDFNSDGRLDIADAVGTLGFLFLAGPSPECDDAADSNDDGAIDMSDALFSLGFLFLGGPAPEAPFPDCGDDPTTDSLGCVQGARNCRVAGIREVLGRCGGIPTESHPNSLRPGSALHKVTLHRVDALCNDGSPAVMYVRPAPAESEHADRWVVYLQGGGSCGTFQECYDRWCGTDYYDASKMSSEFTPNAIGGNGIFRRGENDFGEFNQVYMYYCSSDSWTGRAPNAVLFDEEDPQNRFGIHFLGHRILDAAVEALSTGGLESDDGEYTMPALDDADLVVLSGFSAGSGGVQRNGDWFAEQLEPNGTRVRLVFDSSILGDTNLIEDDTLRSQVQTQLDAFTQDLYDTKFHVWNAFVDQSARDAIAGTGEEWRVADRPYVMSRYITTPFFARTDIADNKTRGALVQMGMTDSGATQLIADTLASLSQLASPHISIQPGTFGTRCGDHTGLTNSNVFFERTVEDASGTPRSYHDTLRRWLQGSDVSVIDDPSNPTTVCGSEQPQDE